LATTCGYVSEEDETFYCQREGCDNTRDADESFCDSCRDERWCCEDCGDEYFSDETCPNGENGSYCDDCYANHCTTCEACSDTFEEDALRYSVRRARSGWMLNYCPDCAEDRHECDTCGDVCENDSPCCPEDDDDDDTPDTTEETPTDSTTENAGTPPSDVVPDVPADVFPVGQVVILTGGPNDQTT